MQKQKILLIEDEEDIAALIKLQAEMAGYKLICAIDGISGYEAIERERPDVIILDIMMPEMDGYNTANWLRSNYPNIKILALSTMDTETSIIKMINNYYNNLILFNKYNKQE